MALLDSELIEYIGWEQPNSRNFRRALTHYLRYMREDEEDNVGLAYEVARQINCRAKEADDFAELVRIYGHETVLELFWFGIKMTAIKGAEAAWKDRDSDPVPQVVIDFFADHFRSCRKCYRLALSRIKAAPEGIAGFLKLFPPKTKATPN